MVIYIRSPERVKEFKDKTNYVFSSIRYLEYFGIEPDIILCEILKNVDGDYVDIRDNDLGFIYYHTEDIEPKKIIPFTVIPEMCQVLQKVEV